MLDHWVVVSIASQTTGCIAPDKPILGVLVPRYTNCCRQPERANWYCKPSICRSMNLHRLISRRRNANTKMIANHRDKNMEELISESGLRRLFEDNCLLFSDCWTHLYSLSTWTAVTKFWLLYPTNTKLSTEFVTCDQITGVKQFSNQFMLVRIDSLETVS